MPALLPNVGLPGYTGLPLGTRESLYEASRRAWDGGWQLATHANGDLAIERNDVETAQKAARRNFHIVPQLAGLVLMLAATLWQSRGQST